MTNNNFYSWQIKEWRNDEWTFSRIQFTSSDIYDTISEVKWLVQEWKEKLFQSPDDFRLDMRFNIPKDMISKILEQKDLSGMDVSLRNFLWDKHSLLTLWQNNKERVLSPKNISEYQKVVLEKCNHTLNFLEQNWGFERYSLWLLEMMKKKSIHFWK